ncbi:amino acid adenylation domain-containing protein [Aquiflexum balticum DSM 16537]|uniref:Amino acid adenylation domain-containing protein n=1 Tax=Aquiflexum balticum DSM 16537 TaxID=758820 RepID=A0A1W2HC73_9BACT|nr:type I polyketide synthase [Aquiflexum balticum]SMD46318.1 amino acid adenylation domain-containing protein [Aquiflexum balticum DSM 16537]
MLKKRILDRFLEVAVIHPTLTAVVFNEKSISYGDLNDRATVLAKAIKEISQDEEIIGISTSRSIEMIIGVLAILKAGKTYMPIDPTYPEERHKNMIEISSLKYVVACKEEEECWSKLGLNRIGFEAQSKQKEIDLPLEPQEVYAVFFTSGSTGKPKGVMVTTQGAVELIEYKLKTSRAAGLGVKTLQFCHLGFDISVKEIFVSLSSGGELHLVEEMQRLDAYYLLNYIQSHEINTIFLPNVSLQYLTNAAVISGIYPKSLIELNTGGEQLQISPHVREFFKELPGAVLKNNYGPTEASMWASDIDFTGDPDSWEEIPSIGLPLAACEFYVLNNSLEQIPSGQIGELHIAGNCLAKGYLNRPDLTASRFISWTSPDGKQLRLYKTGDLVVCKENGQYYFQGREDDQIKIRGNRVELGEIESALINLPNVKHAIVKLDQDDSGAKFLSGYVLFSDQKNADVSTIKTALKSKIPDYMIPDYIIAVNEFPKTSSGKVDKKALPKPLHQRPQWADAYVAPSSELEQQINTVFTSVLNYDKVSIHDNFFEMGGNSLKAQKTIAALKQRFGLELPILKLYQFPSVALVAQYFEQAKKPRLMVQKVKKSDKESRGVAIIGMSLKFPGANSIQDFLEILRTGKETIRFFSKEEIDARISDSFKNNPQYVAARGIIEGYDTFDANFFGLNPKLAAIADPQQRKFLECAYELLEAAGYRTADEPLPIGVYAGCSPNTYFVHNLIPNKAKIESYGEFMINSLNEKDYLASRTAYHLNLTGPAVSVHSACSTALLAVAQAVEAIRSGKCSMAIAGASSIKSPVYSGHLHDEGSVYSKDGHVKSFDEAATGTVFSDGVGVVLLKDLDQAIADGDQVHAVIKGIGINNDGGGKGSFSAPSAEGQAGAIYAAIQDAGVSPDQIGYLEAHATATPLGDPMEIEGLKLAFSECTKSNSCVIGSSKSNIGHLNAAAGIAGLFRAILTIKEKQFFPQAGFQKLNPAIDFEHSPFYLPNGLSDWESDQIRMAGVSSFGVGGTNVHVILEEAPIPDALSEEPKSYSYPAYLFPWSAKSEESLEEYALKLSDFIYGNPNVDLDTISSELLHRRMGYPFRKFIVASDRMELIDKFAQPVSAKKQSEIISETVFLFPGQGAQFLNMGKELYQYVEVFKKSLDTCALILEEFAGIQILDIIFPEKENEEAELLLKDTQYTQPAIFAVEYALSQCWIALGIKPIILCGHSIGEFVAAHLSGVFSLEDALKLVAKRGKMISSLPGGHMLSIRCKEEEIKFLLPDSLSLAGVNGENQCVVAGKREDIADFADLLETKDIPSKILQTSHAFHSYMMDPILEDFADFVATIPKSKPRIPIVSTVTGDFITDDQAQSAEYWTNQLRNAVRFGDACQTLLELDLPLSFLEVGPGNVLTSLIRQNEKSKGKDFYNSLIKSPKASDFKFLLTQAGQLWQNGKKIHWENLMPMNPIKAEIPTYAFKKEKIWIEAPSSTEKIVNKKDNFSVSNITQVFENKLNHPTMDRKSIIKEKLVALIQDSTGLSVSDESTSFMELGFDSLLLTQLASRIKQEFKVNVTFRQLSDTLGDVRALVGHLEEQLPPEMFVESIPPSSPQNIETPSSREYNQIPHFSQLEQMPLTGNNVEIMQVLSKQLELMTQQINLMSGRLTANTPDSKMNPAVTVQKQEIAENPSKNKTAIIPPNAPKTFGAMAKIDKVSAATSPEQDAFIQQLIQRFNEKTRSSKEYTQKHRAHMADPRVVSGFKPNTKEITYSLVVDRSEGSKIWDIDGNEYLDVLNGFGAILFGHRPDFVQKAVKEQMEKGFEIGPQHVLAGEVSELICELTGHERAALCNTGSEAVMAALRMARTVTGRSLVVSFNNSYHGTFDEVIVRGSNTKSYPAAAGIMPSQVENLLVLEYGTEESLEIIRKRKDELAAVLVEPVQSRRPEFQPVEFLKKVREITLESGTALIFDEVITGFRTHLKGAQGLFDIKADIGTYGKVIGGGLPIGAIAGSATFMDALDGGYWQYGDDSMPEVGVTYFTGTFVRHPLALAAAKASLEYFKNDNGALHADLKQKTDRIADSLDSYFSARNLPFYIAHFGSMWKLKYHQELPYTDLIFILMREKGIHIYDEFPCYLTTKITEEDVDRIISAFKESIDELMKAGFFGGLLQSPEMAQKSTYNEPPIPGAKLGKDPMGNPAWFIRDENNPGKFIKVLSSI